eukprot:4821385-Pleurochrysis_carterae.AAC.4
MQHSWFVNSHCARAEYEASKSSLISDTTYKRYKLYKAATHISVVLTRHALGGVARRTHQSRHHEVCCNSFMLVADLPKCP